MRKPSSPVYKVDRLRQVKLLYHSKPRYSLAAIHRASIYFLEGGRRGLDSSILFFFYMLCASVLCHEARSPAGTPLLLSPLSSKSPVLPQLCRAAIVHIYTDASQKQLVKRSLLNCSPSATGRRGGVPNEHQLDRKDLLFIGSGEGFEAGVQEELGLMVRAMCL